MSISQRATMHGPTPLLSLALVFIALLSGLPRCGTSGVATSGAPETLAFNRDVRPILSDNCFQCHGTDANARKADLRLDRRESALSKREGSPAIIPGKPGASELVRRITHPDPAERMPPEDSRRSLEAYEIEILTRWIAQGAEYEEHWSNVPVKRPDPPSVGDDAWAANAIDRFVLAELSRHQLDPVGDADDTTLIRRLSFDLLGLPPTPEQVDAFVTDDSPDAYERNVDALLASPHYGERMAVMWLDLVRFADTNGYNADQHHYIHPYRDYVIDAFNTNTPFDRFTIEQIAGDLLNKPKKAQLAASGYNRLNQVTTEVGAVREEYVAKYAADRVRTTASTWMGATVGCAECHDHKFDPYTSRDFYSFAAFFADLVEEPVYSTRKISLPPETDVPSPLQTERIRELYRDIARETRKIGVTAESVPTELQQEQGLWEEELLARTREADSGTPLSPSPAEWAPIGPGGRAESNGSVILRNESGISRSGVELSRVTLPEMYALRIELDAFEFPDSYSWIDWNIGEARSEVDDLRIRVVRKINGVLFLEASLSGSLETSVTQLGPSHELESLSVVVSWNPDRRRWQFRYGKNGAAPVSPIGSPLLRTREAPESWELSFLLVSISEGLSVRVRGVSQFVYRPEYDDVPDSIRAAVKVPRAERTRSQSDAISAYFTPFSRRFNAERARIDASKGELSRVLQSRSRTLISKSGPRREVRVLPRGDWMDTSGEVVEPDVPAFLGSLPDGTTRDRLGLARWLVSERNPLTARAFVNRLWKIFFGHGIARTLDDLGSQGAWPSHPELLDWLAAEFVESGWDMKHLVKLIVTSHTYRLSSRPSPELLAQDPNNDWWGRQSRFRLDAEFVRDNALRVSGLLTPDIGGRSVQPYQPDGYWENVWTFLERDTPASRWSSEPGPEQYRRGLYTYWKRSFPHPSLVVFDAPTREECVAERRRSNTPLQALVLLNDPTYVESARALAQRIVGEGGDSSEERIDWAHRTVLSRSPDPAARQALEEIYEDHLLSYQADPDSARALLAVGNAPTAPGIDEPSVAAWTSVARVLLNLHETTLRN